MQGFHILKMTGSQSFYPEFLAAAAPVGHFSCFYRHIEGIFVHVGKHQHLICLVILDDDRHHPIAVQLEFRPADRALVGVDSNPRFLTGLFKLIEIQFQGTDKTST